MVRQPAHRWSVGFGSWWGVPVRVHILMILFAIATFAVTIDDLEMLTTGAITVGLLLASVALHEAAHCLAAVRLGGEVDEVVLSPVGGLASPRVPDEPEPQIFVSMVGPMANLALVVAATGTLVAMGEPRVPPLFNPISPEGLLEGDLTLRTIKLTAWVNWSLFLINLLPAYPFDAGAALRAVLWPLLGKRSAAIAVAQVARGVALALLLLGVLLQKVEPQSTVPLWAPMAVLAVFLLFSAQQDLALAMEPAGRGAARRDDLEAAPTPPPWDDFEDEMVLVEQTTEAAGAGRDDKRHSEDAFEDARVDDILARLHSQGLGQLSPEDRMVLERASRRYRDRRRDGRTG